MSGPYGEAWETYRRAGWIGVLPLPPRRKAHPPKGFTGEAGVWPSYADGMAWADGPEAAGNVALRLPQGVLGIDVDAYDGKQGAATLARRVASWGELPTTWESSSRSDGVSRIRFFRIPEGLHWPGELGPDVELIQYRHRYAVVWPSVHPNGPVYRWTTPEGVTSTAVPDVESLPWLPQAWIDGLTGGREHRDTPRNDWDDAQVRQWILTRPRGTEPPCERTRRAVDDALYQLHAGGSAHGIINAAVMRVVRLADEEHAGLMGALGELHGAFIADVTRYDRPGLPRTGGQAEAEWARSLAGAVSKVSASPAGVDGCDCGGRLLAGLLGDPAPAAAPAPVQEERESFEGIWETPGGQETPPAPAEAAAPSLDAFFEQQVAAEMLRVQVREEAARRVRKARRGAVQPPAVTALDDFLAVPDEPARYRVGELWPVGGRAMLAAQFKAGKTTLIGNLVRALADGEPFLGRFEVDRPDGRIVLADNELDERMLRRWLRDQGVAHPERVAVLPLRGRVSSFDLLDDETRAGWAETLRRANAGIVVLDCLAPVLDALGLSEDKEAGRFLVAFDELLESAGVGEAVMVHHMGHSGERARGASRLRDWPDVEWRLVRDKEDGEDNPAARRYFSAYGRDVEVPESALTYEAAGRRLTLAGGSRKESAAAGVAEAVVEFVAGAPDCSAAAIERALRDEEFGQKAVRAGIKAAVADGRVLVRPGPKGARLHYLNPARPVDRPVDNSFGLLTKNGVSAGDEVSSSATRSIGLDGESNKMTSSTPRRAKTPGHSVSSSARHNLVNEVSTTSSARPPYGGRRAADESSRADVTQAPDERDVTDLLSPERTFLDADTGELIDTRTGEVLQSGAGA